jgi:hypothetical protein
MDVTLMVESKSVASVQRVFPSGPAGGRSHEVFGLLRIGQSNVGILMY